MFISPFSNPSWSLKNMLCLLMFNVYLADSGAPTLLGGKLLGVRWNWILNVYLKYLCSL